MVLVAATVVLVALIVSWVLNGSIVDGWLSVHTGISDVSGPWYGFWSGFGSDLAEFGIIGAVGTAVYQVVKKFNCHEPGCWRVGTHPAAGGQFVLCYRHHPDFRGKRPSHEVIERLHADHLRNQAALQERLHELHARPIDMGTGTGDSEERRTVS
jgi:hypothetical protein